MYLRNDDRPQGSRLSLRIAVLGGVAVALFGILFFRLWALQVLSGPQYLRAALDNQLRSVRIELNSSKPASSPLWADTQGFVLTPTVAYPARLSTSGSMRARCGSSSCLAAAGDGTLISPAARGMRPLKNEACDGTVQGAVE